MMVSFVLSFFPRDVLDEILNLIESVSEDFPSYSWTGGFRLLWNVSVAISVKPHVCFILVLILLSLFQSWLVDCFGFNGPLRQYFSLYRAVSQREEDRGEKS